MNTEIQAVKQEVRIRNWEAEVVACTSSGLTVQQWCRDEYSVRRVHSTKLDLTSAETKPTYDEIKDYVFKKFGLKVSTLYISQVKRKLGLEVDDSFNKPKSENAKQPNCPKEKEKAIVEALKCFKVI